jgi:TonB family protein
MAIVICFLAMGLSAGELSAEPLQITESQAKHAAIESPAPSISPMARQMKLTGRVELAVLINEKGAVAETKVMTGNPILASSASLAVRRWKFTPFIENGAPSKAATTLSFEFKQ